MNSTRATWCVVIAGVLWGIISLFTRGLNDMGLSATDIAGIRMLVGMVCMGAMIAVTGVDGFRIRLKDTWLFIGTGVVGITLFNACYFTVIQLSEASIAVALLYTSPVFVMLMSALFFKEKIDGRKILALVITTIGVICVSGMLGGALELSPMILLMGIGSGFFYATYSIFGRVALERYRTRTVTFYTFLAGSACSLFVADWSAVGAAFAVDPLSMTGLCLGIGVVCTTLPYLFYNLGLSNMETSRAGVLATVEPLVGTLVGIFIFAESTGILKLLGIACILASVVLLSVKRRPKGQPAS